MEVKKVPVVTAPRAPGPALLALGRLRLLPFVLILPTLGYGWAHWDRALHLRAPAALIQVLVAWSLLHLGTMWLNADRDRDTGPVLFGRPTAVPPATGALGLLCLLAAFGLGAPVVGWIIGLCALLAVAYSHPRTAWKGHPIGGPAVNVSGYGVLSPLAGWAVVGVAPNPRSALALTLCALVVCGCTFAAQAFQEDEDRARGDRTLVTRLGPARTLHVARLCIDIALLGGIALAALGWLPRTCLALTPAALWIDRYMRDWAQQPGGGDEGRARGLIWRLLATGAAAVLCAWLAHVGQVFADLPAAGRGTTGGLP